MSLKLNFIWTLLAAAVALGTAARSQAQTPGDWDNNGLITSADAVGLDTCLRGPAVVATSGCAAVFDPAQTGIVGMRTAQDLALAIARSLSNRCTPWGNVNTVPARLRGYSGTEGIIYPGGVYGVGARLDTTPLPALCPVPTAIAFSCWWVSMGPTDVVWWFQSGASRERNADSAYPVDTVVFTAYSEIIDAGFPGGRRHIVTWPDQVPVPDEEFTINWRPSFSPPRVFFSIDGQPWDNYAVSNAIGISPAQFVRFQGEVVNVEDRMVGRIFNTCRFVDCVWAPGAEMNFLPLELAPSEIISDVPLMYGARWLAGDRFEIWDWWVP